MTDRPHLGSFEAHPGLILRDFGPLLGPLGVPYRRPWAPQNGQKVWQRVYLEFCKFLKVHRVLKERPNDPQKWPKGVQKGPKWGSQGAQIEPFSFDVLSRKVPNVFQSNSLQKVYPKHDLFIRSFLIWHVVQKVFIKQFQDLSETSGRLKMSS